MNEFLEEIRKSLVDEAFIKLTLSKPKDKSSVLTNIYARLVYIKSEPFLSFTYRQKTNDQTKNFSFNDGIKEIEESLNSKFKNASLQTSYSTFNLMTSKKGLIKVLKSNNNVAVSASKEHDRKKKKRANANGDYLNYLGVTDTQGNVIQKMADKYRQINKYLEIIEGLVESSDLSSQINVVDMGSGKGYLTFALYDFLSSNLGFDVSITGIEHRKDLVDYCNDTAVKCGFDKLKFEQKAIQEYQEKNIDILIALHACDTATDDAIAKGIYSKAKIIVCAPCCHKQIRQSVKGTEQESPLLKYGIFKERQFEMVTDTIRALILEANNYQSKIFEFVSNEHTRKNIMLVGVQSNKKIDSKPLHKIKEIKDEYQIDKHYLETILK